MNRYFLLKILVVVLFLAVSLLGCNAANRLPIGETEPTVKAADENSLQAETSQHVPQIDCPPDPVFGGIKMKTAQVTFPDAFGSPSIVAELAIDEEERTRGLMYRTSLPKNFGMLFVFNDPPRVHTFWMKNTCISLDMMFITKEGYIAGILENVPPMNEESRSLPVNSNYVLEVVGGWSQKMGVTTGQRVILPSL